MTRRAEQACRQMSKQQESMENRRTALDSNGRSFPQDQQNGKRKESFIDIRGNNKKGKNQKGFGKGNKGKGKGKGKW